MHVFKSTIQMIHSSVRKCARDIIMARSAQSKEMHAQATALLMIPSSVTARTQVSLDGTTSSVSSGASGTPARNAHPNDVKY